MTVTMTMTMTGKTRYMSPPLFCLSFSDISRDSRAQIYLSMEKMWALHCKYIRPDYDGIAAIRRTSTMIACSLLITVHGSKTDDQK